MKRFFKIFFISLGSLILLLTIVISIALWYIFTPERLTPIVRNQIPKFITCETEIGQVELTFFSTFPRFGLKIEQLALINPKHKTACKESLLSIKLAEATVDIKALVKKNELLLSDIRLSDGLVCAYIDSLGNTNFDIFPLDTAVVDTTAFEMPFAFIDISRIELKNINVNYIDEQAKMEAGITNISGKINASLKGLDDIDAKMDLSFSDISFTDYASNMKAEIRNLSPLINAAVKSDDVHADIRTAPFLVSFEYDGEKFLDNAEIKLKMLTDVILSRQYAKIENLTASINGMEISFLGSIENDTVNKNMHTDISYSLQSWSIGDLIALVPASFEHYPEGISATGKISSEGKISGVYSDSAMPLLDIHLLLEDGKVAYSELPFPVHGIYGDLNIYTDLTNDVLSYVNINNFKANTPKSKIQTAGKVNKLFSDLHVNLSTNAELNLSEFNVMVPEEMKVDMKGKVTGNIKTDFSLSQIEKMALEKMKISGSLTMNDLDVVYDSISLKANRSKIDFTLPNKNASTISTTFASVDITADNLEANMIDAFSASLVNTKMSLETSDVRDSTRIPAIHLVFQSGSLKADMGSMGVAIENPYANLSIAPQRRDAEQPRFNVKFNSGNLSANMDKETATVDKLAVDATVSYNKNEKDVFLQWMPRGSFALENGKANTTLLPYPVEIPNVKMEFNPREFNIEKASLKLDQSDFKLSGKLSNILSYFRGDSILRGDFTFASDYTDVNQLMSLTSGLGDEENVKETESTYTGPYMVPKGVDIILHTNIKKATFLESELADISGDIQVADGSLVVGELTMTTPGADVQLTAIYQTPRKNHLFVGMDFHLLEIEIADLLNMIPELDTIMPMLRSFAGKGEFHLVAETNLDSLYNPKYSTILGAASVKGIDLVVLDGEMFDRISKILRFNKKTENKVDSFTAEIQIDQERIDVFPFLLAMDKYKVVVGGRHDLNNKYEYNISIVESPFPFRISADIKDEYAFPKPAKAKYPDFYRPASRHVVESEQMRIRQKIRNTLVNQVSKEKKEE